MPETLVRDLRLALPAGVGLGWAEVDRLHPLMPGEDLLFAVPKRRAEFSAGRHAARLALGMELSIPMGADRAPIWPKGWTGSISHCSGMCLALAAKTEMFHGIGLDVEPQAPLDPSLWPTILRPEELVGNGLEALGIFVAKEAAYKAQYAVTRQIFDFHHLSIDRHGEAFHARFCRDTGPFLKDQALEGRFVQSGTFVAAVVMIEAAKVL